MNDEPPTGLDGPPIELPPVFRENISQSRLEELFADLAHLPQAPEVRVKLGPTQAALEDSPSLEQALKGLLTGSWQAVQLVYPFEGQLWLDTLIRRGGEYILVRTSRDTPLQG